MIGSSLSLSLSFLDFFAENGFMIMIMIIATSLSVQQSWNFDNYCYSHYTYSIYINIYILNTTIQKFGLGKIFLVNKNGKKVQ